MASISSLCLPTLPFRWAQVKKRYTSNSIFFVIALVVLFPKRLIFKSYDGIFLWKFCFGVFQWAYFHPPFFGWCKELFSDLKAPLIKYPTYWDYDNENIKIEKLNFPYRMSEPTFAPVPSSGYSVEFCLCQCLPSTVEHHRLTVTSQSAEKKLGAETICKQTGSCLEYMGGCCTMLSNTAEISSVCQ